MVRKLFFKLHHQHPQVRGNEIYRIEALSDAVFAFSVSLLIMSLEVPESFEAFRHTLLNFPAFIATVALVFFFWYLQHCYFRNYGLHTGRVIFLNLCLLAIILFYAFPLKYLFSLLLSWISGVNFFAGEAPSGIPLLTLENFSELVMFFSSGYGLIWLLFLLMYRHAYTQKQTLGLSVQETAILVAEIYDARVQCLIAILGFGFGWLQLPGLSGVCFLMIPVWLLVNHRMLQKKLRKAGMKADFATPAGAGTENKAE